MAEMCYVEEKKTIEKNSESLNIATTIITERFNEGEDDLYKVLELLGGEFAHYLNCDIEVGSEAFRLNSAEEDNFYFIPLESFFKKLGVVYGNLEEGDAEVMFDRFFNWYVEVNIDENARIFFAYFRGHRDIVALVESFQKGYEVSCGGKRLA